MSQKPNNVLLKGRALEIARKIAQIDRKSDDAVDSLRREFEKKEFEIRREAHKRIDAAFRELHDAAGVPRDEIGDWGLDVDYVDDLGIAVLSRREEDREEQTPTLSDLLQSMTHTRH